LAMAATIFVPGPRIFIKASGLSLASFSGSPS
jgi:hypothetical protein